MKRGRIARFTVLPAVVVAAVSLGRARKAANRWGATGEECGRALPGDDVVREPDLTSTRAITIAAPPEGVFPWLAQLGQGRGGFYSYDWLENRTGLDIHSADHVIPEHQELGAGDHIPVAPGPPFYGFVVEEVAAPGVLVLRMRIHPFTGLRVEPEATPQGWLLDASWAFVLAPLHGTSTRLVTRTRAGLALPFGLKQLYGAALEVIEFVMERRMMLGIRERAERQAPREIRAALRPA